MADKYSFPIGHKLFAVWMALFSCFLFIPFVYEPFHYTIIDNASVLLIAFAATFLTNIFLSKSLSNMWKNVLGGWFCAAALPFFHYTSIWLVKISGSLGFLTWLGCAVIGVLLLVYSVTQPGNSGFASIVICISYILVFIFCFTFTYYRNVIPAYVVWSVGIPVLILILFAIMQTIRVNGDVRKLEKHEIEQRREQQKREEEQRRMQEEQRREQERRERIQWEKDAGKKIDDFFN